MANQGGAEVPHFKKGSRGLTAKDLNSIVKLIAQRIYGADPISVQPSSSGITIAWRKKTGRGPPSHGGGDPTNVHCGKIISNNGDGTYVYNRTQGGAGTANVSGFTGLPCKELNSSVYAPTGRTVFIVTADDGNDYFDLTLDDAS